MWTVVKDAVGWTDVPYSILDLISTARYDQKKGVDFLSAGLRHVVSLVIRNKLIF